MKIFSAWSIDKKSRPHTFSEGDDAPVYHNGSKIPDCNFLCFTIQACNYEEAMAIYHLRQGWEPYKPVGEASPCPKCGALYYAKGSGQCWNCLDDL